jgi:hypothetical protein
MLFLPTRAKGAKSVNIKKKRPILFQKCWGIRKQVLLDI